MPTILAIETSSELASVALLRDGKLICQEASGPQTHSQTLLPMVQQLLAESGIGLAGCDAIAFGSGPGSFTGVRTACGVAQGLAFGADLPVIPIVTLSAMAQACRDRAGVSDVVTVLDARMNEVYWAQYRHSGREWQIVTAPTLSMAADVVPAGDAIACGNGLTAYASQLGHLRRDAGCFEVMPHAGPVAALAQIEFEKGILIHARDARPLYLRNKVALTTEERRAKVVA
ncbi:MAG TPA: tRNA (adenosine(37)-N6)-threonylcarbamoyltransferase complex dimerization subunit type 1 TsaB [Noviherbaspirillum sp.]|jgi:tRNA threonylcarbamoyladenosine biosynthesis protein TsaB|uniref:tRNA (adenosine(37)-N6)-threonylcarbamoyltransferase complex dimerization subunit type 1 TsaB n=1 Tax=Noviherbaspirillum sp. TaxID=1926288 RepID=UPI002DDD37B8|nr:tRNA (adenosine(37)-N6)-threonylcarbamoyltransferase complex dimerization subunit type 1 TsaB [Noviherbaspirillum sp.]HEV2610961.1 tRNA (adenosine(37)-N6)-threonylcarbamoyltransferase complex dimerization subunit type 1 TsaB [Noviherbaspirillum sp.]